MTEYENRQRWDLDAWPEMYGTLKELQAHGAYGLNSIGMETDKIEALWSFEESELFEPTSPTRRRARCSPSLPSADS